MATLSTSQVSLSRAHAKGVMRHAFDRLIAARHLQAHRYVSNLSVQGHDRLDLADMERRSLFDTASPERN